MQLNGWQRWGILLSILWALGAGLHQRNADVEHAESFTGFAYNVAFQLGWLGRASLAIGCAGCDGRSVSVAPFLHRH